MADIPTTMRAVRALAKGGSDQIALEQRPVPAAGDGRVLVRIRAAGVNPIDWKLREGMFPGPPFPFTPGQDLAGDVVDAGGAEGFAAGDRVYAMLGMDGLGAYAEYVAAPVGALAKAPTTLSATHAAAAPMGALTAWLALYDAAELQSGERVLIHGAGGAVGGMAVQLAKARGAWVAATASGDDVARLRAEGVDLVIDYKAERFEDAVRSAGGVDLVLDVMAGETRDRSWAVLRDGGRMVSTLGPTEPPAEAQARGVRGLAGIGATPDGARLTQVAAMIDAGTLSVPEPTVMPLARAAEAMDLNQSGRAHGKLVLNTDG